MPYSLTLLDSTNQPRHKEHRSRRRIRAILFSLIIALIVASSSTAAASPWTLPADELVFNIDQTFQHADHEYLVDGTYQAFPLNAHFRSQSMRLGARYGFSDRFEGAIDITIGHLTYSADTLILNEFDEIPSPGEATETILDFNSSQFGAADLRLQGHYNLLAGPVMVTTGTTVKFPTGYEQPTGTFFTDKAGNTRTGGQATLGDGQTDVMQSLLLGTYIAETETFMAGEAAFRYRFSSPGHQAVANLRVGQYLNDSVIAIAGLSGETTLTEGEVIGETFVAVDPSVSNTDFTGDNIEVRDLRLDRDVLNINAGLLFDLGAVEVTANYGRTMWGRNVAAAHSFTVGTIFAIEDVTGRNTSDLPQE